MSYLNQAPKERMDLPTRSIVICGSFDLTACSENVDSSKEIGGCNTGISWSFQLTVVLTR
jgi:hypothetical protein